MKRNVLILITVVAGFTLSASAGTIGGQVSGVAGQSVVYVDTISGKTFPAPTQHPVIDQKGLVFQPHVTAVLVGTTVDFLNSDSVAHNVFWTSIGGNKKLGHNLGTWPKGRTEVIQVRHPWRGANPLQCSPGDVGLSRGRAHSLLCHFGSGRKLQD
jgi:plastocyanin